MVVAFGARMSLMDIQDHSLHFLAELIKENKIKCLFLDANSISSVGAKILAAAIKETDSLLTLVLDNNQIDDQGAEALADALKVNDTLIVLSLQGNCISNNGAIAFSSVLDINHSLTYLRLENNKVEELIIRNIKDKTETNLWQKENDVELIKQAAKALATIKNNPLGRLPSFFNGSKEDSILKKIASYCGNNFLTEDLAVQIANENYKSMPADYKLIPKPR